MKQKKIMENEQTMKHKSLYMELGIIEKVNALSIKQDRNFNTQVVSMLKKQLKLENII